MPIQTNILNPTTATTRRRQRNPLNAQHFNGLPGALNLTGVEQELQTTVGALHPNLQAEQDARLAQTQREFQQAQEQLGRQFALTPGGTTTPGLQGGEQQRAFEQLNLGNLNLNDSIRADIASRTGAEQRANISTLAGLQGQGFTQGINLANVDLQRRQQTQSEAVTGSQLQNDSLNRAIASSGVTGQYTDPQTGQTFTTQQVKQYQDQLALQQSQVTGTFNGQQTEAARAARVQEGLQGRQVTVSEAAQSTDATLRAEALRLQDRIQTGQLSIEQANQQLNDFVQRGQLGVQQGQLDLATAAQSADINLRTEAQRLQTEIQRGSLSIDQANQSLNDFVQRGQLGVQQGQLSLATAAQSADINLRQEAQRLQTEIQRGSLSIDQANQSLNDFVQREQVRLQGQQTQSQLQTESLQRAIAAGSQTGQFVDPQTGQAYTTEEVRQFNEQLNLQKAGLKGKIDGEDTLQGRAQQVTELDAALQRAVAQGNATGIFTDPMTGVSQQTLQAEIARAEIGLQESAANLAEAAQVAVITGKFVHPVTGEVLDTLAKTDQAFQQELQESVLTGDFRGIATLAARSLVLQELEVTGQVGDQKTVAQKTLDLQTQIQKGQLALQQESERFGQNITEAELIGTYNRMGNATGAFQASFNAKSGDANYNSRYDFDGNGTVDFSDWNEFSKISNNEPVQTLQGQVVQQQKAVNDFNKKVTESGLTGTFAGNQTVQEAQRRFENSMKESQLFVDAPPMTLNWGDYEKAFNSQQGQANYRQDLDLDKNGTVNFTDFIEIVGSGRIEVLSGSVTDPINSNLTFTYKPEGKTSVIAAQLGLDEKRLSEQTRQFNEQYKTQNAQFLTNATGYLFDGDGNVQSKWIPASPENMSLGQSTTVSGSLMDSKTKQPVTGQFSGQIVGTEQVSEGGVNEQRWIMQTSDGRTLTIPTSGVYVASPVSTVERSQMDEQRRQFNSTLDVQVKQFLDQLGLSYDTLKNEKDATKYNALAQIIAAALGAVGQIKASGSSINPFGGGGNNSSSFIPFGTIGNTSTGSFKLG